MKYELEITPKTRFLNFFRNVFKFKPFEPALVTRTIGKSTESLIVRLMPPNYLYRKGSRRRAQRNGINYSLDVSDFMEHAVYFGYVDPAQQALFRLARNKKTIIDVGTNIGAVLLNFARLSPDGKIFGFEPDSGNYAKALKNLELNDFENITLVRKGLGAKASTAKLFRVNENNEGMNRILENGDGDFEEVEIITLDSFAGDLNRIDLIKIDVEGYELQVLRGAAAVLRKFKPDLFIELDDAYLRKQNDSAQDLVAFLENYDYDIRRADNDETVKNTDPFDGCHFDIVCRGI